MPPITPFPNVIVALRTLQFVAVGLIGGLTIAVIAFTFTASRALVAKPVPAAEFFVYVGVIAGLMQTLASFFLRSWMLSPDKLSKLPVENWEMAAVLKFRTATMVSLALCEAGGFLFLVFTLMAALNGAAETWCFAGAIIPLYGMVLHFPSQAKWEQVRADTMRVKGIVPVESAPQ